MPMTRYIEWGGMEGSWTISDRRHSTQIFCILQKVLRMLPQTQSNCASAFLCHSVHTWA